MKDLTSSHKYISFYILLLHCVLTFIYESYVFGITATIWVAVLLLSIVIDNQKKIWDKLNEGN
jgi:hypothetical protein